MQEQYPDTPLEEANRAILRDWVISLSDQGLNENSINRKLVTVRSFFKFLIKKGTVKKNPALTIASLKVKKRLPYFVREGDVDQIFAEEHFEKSFSGQRDRLVLELLYGTGMRLSELVNLEEKMIDKAQGQIKVLGKRNKERIIPIPAALLELINSYTKLKFETFNGNASHYLIVSNKGEKSYPMMINRIVKKYLRESSVDKKSPHILRHTYATHLLEKGADLNAVKDLLGHQSLAATQVYTHNSLGKLKKVFDRAHPKS